MKKIVPFIAVLSVLLFSNLTAQTDIVLHNVSGQTFEYWMVFNSGNVMLKKYGGKVHHQELDTAKTHYIGHKFGLYVLFEDETDLQYAGEDRSKWSFTLSSKLKSTADYAYPTTKYGSKFHYPFAVDLDTSIFVIEVSASFCTGNCVNGKGIWRTDPCESYDGGFLNGLPHGFGSYVLQDTLFQGIWNQGVMDGEFLIKTLSETDFFQEVCFFQNGVREGESHITLGDGQTWMTYNYKNGLWHNLQIQHIYVNGRKQSLKAVYDHGILVSDTKDISLKKGQVRNSGSINID